MDSQSDVLLVDTVLHVAKHECVLPLHLRVESKDAFLMPSSTEDHLVVGVKDKEIDETVTLVSPRRSIHEVSSTDIYRVIRSILVQ